MKETMLGNEADGSVAEVNIAGILDAGSVKSHFQPIFSVKQRRIVGLEALARATDPVTGAPVAPTDLFAAAGREGMLLPLDRLCRKRGLEGFAAPFRLNPSLIAFINIDASAIDEQVVGSNHLLNLVRKLRLSPHSVAIEVVESKIRDLAAMVRFVGTYRDLGFLIVLDDLGTRRSNLDRIAAIKPDIIKLDRTLIAGIASEYHQQLLFDSSVRLAHNFGAMVVAEGVETEEEALACLERGADLVQGFHFARPEPVERLYLYAGLSTVVEVDMALKSRMKAKSAEQKNLRWSQVAVADDICAKLHSCTVPEYDAALAETIADFTSVECAYVLQEAGIQISSTVFNPKRKHRARSSLFDPASTGADQSSKPYYLLLDETQPQYVSDPYVSLATGSICVTVSTLVMNKAGHPAIVCIDFAE